MDAKRVVRVEYDAASMAIWATLDNGLGVEIKGGELPPYVLHHQPDGRLCPIYSIIPRVGYALGIR